MRPGVVLMPQRSLSWTLCRYLASCYGSDSMRRKFQTTLHTREDGTRFNVNFYATDAGFYGDWSCRSCKATGKIRTMQSTDDAALASAMEQVKNHRCPD